MKFVSRIVLLILFCSIFLSCTKDEKVSVLKDTDLKSQMLDLYKEGYEVYFEGDTLFAAQKFNEAELIFPQSEWAPIAALMTAYVYYSDDYYSDAIYHLKRFIKVYPNHKELDYAHYLLAICYYENVIDEQRDLGPLLNAKTEFELLINNFPKTDYAEDAKFKLNLIEDRLAGKEMYIARHYVKSKKWIPAIKRFKNVVENYDTSVYVEEALHRLAEIHYFIGLENEAKKYAALLGYNYGSGKWYKATYKIFNKDYDINKVIDINEKKKNKKKLFKRLKQRLIKLTN